MKLDIKVGEVIEPVSHEQAVKDFEAVIEGYKVQNPAKYELKKDALEAQLAKLKGKPEKVAVKEEKTTYETKKDKKVKSFR